MKSKYFTDPALAVDVFVETFSRAAKDAQILDMVSNLNQLVYFDYTQDHPEVSFYVDSRNGKMAVGRGKPDEKPDVTMINSVDTAHKAWSNKLNPVVAIATGKIKAKGSATALLKLAPLLKRIAPLYNQVLEEKGLGDIKL